LNKITAKRSEKTVSVNPLSSIAWKKRQRLATRLRKAFDEVNGSVAEGDSASRRLQTPH
jgi:hypothetical protein